MGFISEDQINRLKDSLDIIDVVSSYVELKPSGANHKGLCPFHHEKTPSFMVSPQRNSFHCFGCGEGGDAISFIMKIENLDYIGAIRFLADKLGIVLEETDYNKELTEKRQKLYEINSLAAKFFFRNMLLDKKAQSYIQKRGFDIKIVNSFFLGYARSDNSLYRFLLEQKIDVEDMLELGLVGKSRDDGSYYDKFRDRLMFPILNNKQKVIGFGGRTISDNKIKYLNSPESPVFIKGDNLYGVYNLQKRVSRDKIILVEGYMDVIGLYNHGIDFATASLGTALTENQAKLVKRYGKNVYIAYDSDTAGIKATLRAIDIFAKIDVEPRIVEFPDSMDPDEYVKAYGVDNFNKLLKAAKNSLDYKMDLEISKGGDKLSLTNRMIEFLSDIEGNAKREIYVQKVSRAIEVSVESLMEDVEERIGEKKKVKNSFPNMGFDKKNGYQSNQKDNAFRPDQNMGPGQVISKDLLRLKLEKELLTKLLINKEYYRLLSKKTDEFVKSDYLLALKRAIDNHYQKASDEGIEEILSTKEYMTAGIKDLVDAQSRSHKEGIEVSVSEELVLRLDRFVLEERQEDVYSKLRGQVTKEEKISLIKELVEINSKLTQ